VAAWYKSIIQWIRKKLGRKRRSRRPQVVKRYYSSECAILELHRDTPSARATYRIIPVSEGHDYLTTLDSLREIEGEMVGEFDREVVFLRSHPHPVGSTHRFAFFRIRRDGGNVHCIGCWDMDLEFQGTSLAASTLAPKRIVSTAILRLLKLDILQGRLGEKIEGIESIDWVRLISAIAKQYAPHHHINAIAVTFVSEGGKGNLDE
jgi:hypothetical protein